MKRIRTHPGEILFHEFLAPMALTARAVAISIGVPANRLTDIIRARRDISADTAIRLAKFFGTSSQFWINLQSNYNLSKAEAEHDYSKIQKFQN